MPARIVVWTSDFRVEVVSSRTGRVLRTLATGVAEIHGLPHLAVSSSGVVYFDAARGIRQWVMRVPLAGGRPAVVAEGCMPAISPDGRLLAFVTNCDDAAHAPEAIEVRNLATRRESRWAFPSYDHAVSAIAWSPDNHSLSFTFVGSQLGETGTRVLDTRSPGTLLLASPMRLGPGVQWAGYLTRRVGLAVEPSPGHPGRAVLAEVAVRNGRILRQLTTLSPPELATANIYDGTENTIIADPASRAVLIAGVGRRGSGAIYRWAFGMAKPVMIISGSSRAAWAGR